MKKLIALALVLAMMLCFAGCGKKDVKLKIINEELGAEYYGIAYRNGEDETCKIMDAAVQELVNNGTYKTIAEKEDYKEIYDNLLFLGDDYTAKKYDVDLTTIEKRTFTMGIDPEYPPFSYLGDDGNYTGFDVEICKAACELLGWELKVFTVDWDSKLIQLDAKECDCIWSGMTILDSMKDNGYVISEPYYYNTQVLVVKEGEGIESSKDLKGKVVAVQKGTSGANLLDDDLKDLKSTFKEVKQFKSFLLCFTELESGGVDAVFVDYPVAKTYVEKKK
ncbi:MAG: transporter substrate-binding domain-containing protein [Clostridia bacterium]|nr:transporter substrate-binding domain-containing protein [Clostridia bacterium]